MRLNTAESAEIAENDEMTKMDSRNYGEGDFTSVFHVSSAVKNFGKDFECLTI